MRRKKWLITGAVVLVVAAVIGAIVWNSATAWERDFTVKYVDYVSAQWDGALADYHLYEITNNTKRTVRNVCATIHVDNPMGMNPWKDFNFEDFVALSIKPGETIEYRMYWSDVQDAAKEHDAELLMATTDIIKLYNK